MVATSEKVYGRKQGNAAYHAIELPDGNICISYKSKNALVITDKKGTCVKQITKPLGVENYSPWGLAYDKKGNILSADYNNKCVYIIDQDFEVKELVGKSHGVMRPRWLAVDRDDNLWITLEDGYIKIVKYLA